jgi:putative OPT family oligopeptide transporter
MGPSQIWTRYVRYIGAGAVATGGLITLIRSLPMMLSSMRIGARELRRRMGGESAETGPRTSLDLPLGVVGVSAGIIFLVMALLPFVFGSLAGTAVRIAAALLVVVFSFFFVTVSSRIVGLVGVTSNPTSGMTIASLLGTSTIFFFMGWTDDLGRAAALTVGCVVAIAASIAGDTSQDLKTGFLLGATPRSQQLGEMAGVLTCAVFVCLTLIVLDRGYGFGTTELPAPQATLMKVVIEGVLQNELPWLLVGIGSALAILAELIRIPSLPFAVGVYLPVSTMTPLFFGGLLRWWMERTAASAEEAGERRESGILLGSGLVGGTGLLGVAIAGVAAWKGSAPEGLGAAWAGSLAPFVGFAVFAAMVVWFARSCRRTAP